MRRSVRGGAARRALQRASTLLGAIGLALLVALGSAVAPPSQPASAEVAVLNTVNTGTFSESVAVDPTTNRIFVVNTGSGVGTGSVSVLDGRTHVLLGTISIPVGNPYGVAVYAAGRKAFVTNTGTDTVAIIDIDGGAFGTLSGSTLSAVTTQRGIAVDNTAQRLYIALPSASFVFIYTYNAGTSVFDFVTFASVQANPEQIAVNETTGKAYVTSTSTNNVSIIGPGPSYTVTTQAVGATQQGVAVNPTTNMVYVTSPSTGALIRWDEDSPATVDTDSFIGSGGGLYGVAVNPNTSKAYISRTVSGSPVSYAVLVYDERANEYTDLITVGATPRGVTINPNSGFIYVANRGSATLSVLGVPHLTETTLATTDTGSGTSDETDLAINPVTNRLYVINTSSGTLAVLNSATLQPVAGSPLAISGAPVYVAVDTVANRVYVVQRDSFSVAVIDGATNALLGSISLGTGANPGRLAVDSERHLVYVPRSNPSRVMVIDGSSGPFGAVIATLDPDNALNDPVGVAYNPDARRLYVANTDNVTVINTVTNAAVGSAIAPGLSQGNLDVDPTTGRLYVSLFTEGAVAVFDVDGDANTLVTRIVVPSFSTGVSINPLTNRVYVANFGNNGVSIIDGATNTVVGLPLAAMQEPGALAFNLRTNRTYVIATVNTGAGGYVLRMVMRGPTYSSNVSLTLTPGPVQVTFGALFGAHAGDKIGLFPAGAASNASPIATAFTNGTGSGAPVFQGTVTLPVQANQAAGSYEIRFVSGHGGQTLASVAYRVGAAPAAVDESYSTNAGVALTRTADDGLLKNVTDDMPRANLVASVVSQPSSGTLTVQPTGAFTYTPATGFGGQVSFTFKVTDSDGFVSATRTATINVYATPAAANDSYSVNNGSTLTVPANGVLANDTDADTAPASLTAAVVSGPVRGTLSLQPSGAFTYTPAASFSGTDTFTYKVTDPQSLTSNTATVTITVNAVACGPRPGVKVVTSVSGGALIATVTASDVSGPTQNRLQTITFGTLQNAQVTLNGAAISSGQLVQAPAGTTSVTLTVRRTTAGQATTVPFTVVDLCGSWPSFVGGGPNAGF